MLHVYFFFFFNDTATTEIYTLSLHDALPIFGVYAVNFHEQPRKLDVTLPAPWAGKVPAQVFDEDRKSTRLNSSHANISYAVFCLKKKKKSLSPFLVYKSINVIESTTFLSLSC